MSKIEQRKLFEAKLIHMKMSMKKGGNEFLNAKQAGKVLADYIDTSAEDYPWVQETIDILTKKHHVPKNRQDQVLRGKALAIAWNTISDPNLKQAAFLTIKKRWFQCDPTWWDSPPKGVARQAKAIYQIGEDSWD